MEQLPCVPVNPWALRTLCGTFHFREIKKPRFPESFQGRVTPSNKKTDYKEGQLMCELTAGSAGERKGLILTTWIKASLQWDLGGGINTSERRGRRGAGNTGQRKQPAGPTEGRGAYWVCRKSVQGCGNQA